MNPILVDCAKFEKEGLVKPLDDLCFALTTYSVPLLLETFQPGLDVHQFGGRECLLCVVIFGDPHDNVHHIRHAAGAFGAPIKLGIDLGGDDQLPRIGLEQIEHDVLDLRDDVIILHWQTSMETRRRRFLNGPHLDGPYMNVNVI